VGDGSGGIAMGSHAHSHASCALTSAQIQKRKMRDMVSVFAVTSSYESLFLVKQLMHQTLISSGKPLMLGIYRLLAEILSLPDEIRRL
jgi:hypothetical protein